MTMVMTTFSNSTWSHKMVEYLTMYDHVEVQNGAGNFGLKLSWHWFRSSHNLPPSAWSFDFFDQKLNFKSTQFRFIETHNLSWLTTRSTIIWDSTNILKSSIRPGRWSLPTLSIIDRAFPYKSGMKTCDLCSTERMHIALGKDGFQKLPPDCILLNRRSEIMGKCRHKLSYTLSKVKEGG